jgi:hypothetical protein
MGAKAADRARKRVGKKAFGHGGFDIANAVLVQPDGALFGADGVGDQFNNASDVQVDCRATSEHRTHSRPLPLGDVA